MTPIEIIEAWCNDKSLEYRGLHVQDLAIKVECKTNHEPSPFKGVRLYTLNVTKRHPDMCIKRETFGFDEARKRLESGEIVGKRDYIYRINNTTHTLEYRTQSTAWLPFSGYPLDWPDAQDFYEVE